MQTKNVSTQAISKPLLFITILLFILRIIISLYPSNSSPKEVSKEVKIYLEQAISIIEKHSIKAKEIDFKEFRNQTFADAAGAKTPDDAYDALRKALTRLGDRHSFLSTFTDWGEVIGGKKKKTVGMVINFSSGVVMQILPNSVAEQKGVKLGDIVLEMDDQLINSLTKEKFNSLLNPSIANSKRNSIKIKLRDSQDNIKPLELAFSSADIALLPTGKKLFNNIGYINLPMQITGGNSIQEYADKTQEIIKQLDNENICGWIVDLRQNQGGNMWPMLAGIGPVLGEGIAGSYIYLDPNQKPQWSYKDGKAFDETRVVVAVNKPYILKKTLPPVAILTSELTASSGEAIVVSFKGRSQTRFFGQSTYGVPTANVSYPLSDGAKIVLTVALEADRTSKTYSDKIAPDEELKIDWRLFAIEQDPVIIAANNWLKTQYRKDCK